MTDSAGTGGETDVLRRRAFAIGYRMLGSVAEAEDVVQETLLRLHRAGDTVETPAAFVSTVATRLAIDQLRSARVRRERYVGEWLPEPLVEDPEGDPVHRAEMVESLSFAFLAVLERLSPDQRAVLLLRDVFGYDYDEIAGILERKEPSVRQLAVRARRHVREERPRFAVSRQQRERLATSFFAALERGDLPALEATLAEDVVLHGDGGGKAPALARSVKGRDRIGQTLMAWAALGRKIGGSLEPTAVNGGPGALVFDGEGRVVAAWSLEVDGDRIVAVSSVVNPDKLRHLGEVGNLTDTLRAARDR